MDDRLKLCRECKTDKKGEWKMKTIKSVTLENGITVELLEGEYNYQIVSSVGGYPETIAHLDRAITKFENRVNLYSRFVKSKIYLKEDKRK